MGEKTFKGAIPLILILFSAASTGAEAIKSQDGSGTYVGGLPAFYTSNSAIKGSPSITKEGIYIDGTPKEIPSKSTWLKIKAAIDKFELSSK